MHSCNQAFMLHWKVVQSFYYKGFGDVISLVDYNPFTNKSTVNENVSTKLNLSEKVTYVMQVTWDANVRAALPTRHDPPTSRRHIPTNT